MPFSATGADGLLGSLAAVAGFRVGSSMDSAAHPPATPPLCGGTPRLLLLVVSRIGTWGRSSMQGSYDVDPLESLWPVWVILPSLRYLNEWD